MKVYVATIDCYEGFLVLGVFTEKTPAQNACDMYVAQHYCISSKVEEFELDVCSEQ